VRPTFSELYRDAKILRGRVTLGTYDDTGILCNDSIIVFKRFIDLKDVNVRSVNVSISKNNLGKNQKKGPQVVKKKRAELEKLSEHFSLKYILAVINSTYAIAHLNNFRRHRLENYFYPDDFRYFPIPDVDEETQQILSKMVDDTIGLKQKRGSSEKTNLEYRIDVMVYKLFQLSYDVVQEIDSIISSYLSKEEYEALTIQDLAENEIFKVKEEE
jgi:hypothetical protein